MKPIWNTPAGELPAATEGKYYIYLLSFSMIPAGKIFMVSGELPQGLYLNDDGSITGVPQAVNRTTSYSFSVRLENEEGISDRGFTMTVNNTAPVWVTPSVITRAIPPNQTYQNREVIEFQFEAKEEGEDNITYELVGGDIPSGTTLREDGMLIGYITDVGANYIFTIRAHASEPIDKTFQLRVLDSGQNRVPYWSTLTGWIGDIYENQTVSFYLTGADSDPDEHVNFTLVQGTALPAGLSLAADGHVYGVLAVEAAKKISFDVNITDGNYDVVRTFFFRCNYSNDTGDIWIIPPINPEDPTMIGSLQQDEASYLNVTAVNTSLWVKYELSAGELPAGLSIKEDTGNIVGSVALDARVGTYSFTIRAYNDLLLEDFISLKIIVTANGSIRKYRVSTIITGDDRMRLMEAFKGDKIPTEVIYRADDFNFGYSMSNELSIKRYVDFADENALYSIVENKPSTVARPLTYRTFPVLNSIGKKICESVVLMFEDDNYGGVSTPAAPLTSLDTIRDDLQSKLNAPRGAFQKWHTDQYKTDIRNDSFISPNHDLYTGKIVYMVNQDIPSPFLNDVVYYAIVINKDTYRLAMTAADASIGEYVRFNINDTDRSGFYYTHHNAIPVVYVKSNEGTLVANRLNAMMSNKNVALYLKWLTYGNTESKGNKDMKMIVFHGGRSE